MLLDFQELFNSRNTALLLGGHVEMLYFTVLQRISFVVESGNSRINVKYDETL